MAPPIVSVEDINPLAKRYTIEVIVLEKGMQRTTSKMSRPYQRIVLQDVEGNKIQGTIFGEDITTLENTLRVHSTYAISNASVDKVDIQHRNVDHKFQLIINARTPIEAKQIEGLTIRTLDFNFTALRDIQNTLDGDQKIDALFAILNVGPRKKVKNSSVVDMRIIDQGMIPRTISLWDQFSEHEAGAMRNLPGAFPIAIGFRLKITTNYGVALATRNSSTFILNPSIQEAIGLQAWCSKNATKIRELRDMPQGRPLVPKAAPPKREAIVSIATYQHRSKLQPLLFGVEGIIEIVAYGQRFIYMSCSICYRGTNAAGNDTFWCNYCGQNVPPQPRIKFNVELTDATGTITAAIFADTAEEFYNITTDEMNANIVDDQLQWPMLERLTGQRECSANLKAYNYGYGGISQCRFNITSIFNRVDDSFENDHGPPAKKGKIHHNESGSSAGAPQANKSFNMATTGDNSEDDETNHLAKKND